MERLTPDCGIRRSRVACLVSDTILYTEAWIDDQVPVWSLFRRYLYPAPIDHISHAPI